MITWLVGLALAGSVQRVHELEWERAPAAEIAAEAEGSGPEVRAAAAQALGRLHDPAAVAHLVAFTRDTDLDVRAATADALGWTEGGAGALRSWLDGLEPPTGLAQRAASAEGPRVRAIEALGRQGDASDRARLETLLAEPWPTSAAAAHALGRLGRRKVAGVSEALPALVDALSRPDPRTVEAAAYAIRRIGLEEAAPSLVDRVATAAEGADRPQARAWLVAAAFPRLEATERGDRFIAAVTDPSPLVQVAALDAIGGEDLPSVAVAPWAGSDDGWVRQAAIAALGRLDATEALQEVADRTEDPWERAWAIQAAGDPLEVDWTDEANPLVVRAAALEASGLEADALVEIARGDAQSVLRTAACSALLATEDLPESVAESLLGARDPVVREAGLELLARLEAKAQAEALLVHLRAERDHELLGTALAQLDGLLADDPRIVKPDDRYLDAALRRVAASDTARVRQTARRLAGRLELTLPDPTEPDATRELILPSGAVVEVTRGHPVVDQVRQIRSARVRTSRGEFTVALDPQTAPLAVANFAKLVRAGFFDGLVFHRVVPGFVVQTGCPRGDGWGGPGWTIPDEVSARPYDVGSLGMARSSPWDTGGSQWFITTGSTPHLEGDYTRFGEVVQGLHVVRALRRGDQVLSVELERVPVR